MSCDCIEFITNGLTEKGYVGVIIKNQAWMLDGGGPKMFATFEHEVTLKNGKKRKKEMNLSFSYCPFCGIEYQKLNKTTAETAKLGADAIDQPILGSAT